MSRTTRVRSQMGPGCLMLFALPFAAVGVGMLGLLVWTYLEYAAVQHWEETPARIVRTDLEVHQGEDSTTYQATAEYTYVFGDRPYTGTRVSLHGGSDNIGSFQKRAYEELRRHEKSGQPFRCYVNPGDPAHSILYRELRWEMLGFYTLFALTFGGAGFGMLFGGLYSRRKTRAQAALAAEHPGEPWTWREDWARGEIRSSDKKLLLFAWIFTFFWNLVPLPVLFLVPSEVIDKGNRRRKCVRTIFTCPVCRK